MKLHYQKHLKLFSKELRKQGILSEVLLWGELKGNKLGIRFLRQRPIGKYVVDFYCHKLNLAIEVDGAASHDSKVEKDIERQKVLESSGVHVVKVTDSDVRYNMSGVVEMIKEKILRHQSDHPPLQKEEKILRHQNPSIPFEINDHPPLTQIPPRGAPFMKGGIGGIKPFLCRCVWVQMSFLVLTNFVLYFQYE
ncbi:MAG: DUF559 domain-containing protein [bacterium]|nr:DUF559 domain-containing protein [bacterium]